MLGQRQLINRLVRIGLGELCKPGTRLTPPVRGTRQGLVVLQCESSVRCHISKGLAIGLHRLVVLAVLRELASLIKLTLVDGALGNRCPEFAHARIIGSSLHELVKVLLSNPRPAGARFHGPQSGQGCRITRVRLQQLLPSLARKIEAPPVFPVTGLLCNAGFGSGLCIQRGGARYS